MCILYKFLHIKMHTHTYTYTDTHTHTHSHTQTVGGYEDTIFQKRMRELRRQKDRVGQQRYRKQQVRSSLCDPVCVCACVCVHACVFMCVFMFLCVCVRVYMHVALLIFRVGHNCIYTVYVRYNWQGNHHVYGHIQC